MKLYRHYNIVLMLCFNKISQNKMILIWIFYFSNEYFNILFCDTRILGRIRRQVQNDYCSSLYLIFRSAYTAGTWTKIIITVVKRCFILLRCDTPYFNIITYARFLGIVGRRRSTRWQSDDNFVWNNIDSMWGVQRVYSRLDRMRETALEPNPR